MAVGLTASIANDGQTPILANLPMSTFRHTGVGNGVARTDYAALGQLQDGEINWAAAGGTANAITATYSPAITALPDGQLCGFRASAPNTTTTPTFAPNGLPAHTITQAGGQAVTASSWAANSEVLVRYNLANTRWEMVSAPILAGLRSGATVTSPMSANLVLTATSNQVQTVAPNAMGLAIQLPDATGFTVPVANVFVLNSLASSGSFPVAIIDSASTIVGWVLPGARVLVHLDSIAAATGNWRIQGESRNQNIGFYEFGSPAYVPTNATTFICSVQLDSTYGILFFIQSATYKSVGYKIVDGSPQFGAPVTVDSTAPAQGCGVRLSATEAFFAYMDNTNGSKAVTVDLNTSTLVTTVNSAATIDAGLGNSVACDVISSSLVLVSYSNATLTKVVTVSISAGACTVNTPSQIGASVAQVAQDIVVLSATLAHWSGVLSGSTMSFIRIVLSGSSISSVGTPVTQVLRTRPAITKVSATVSACVYTDSASSTAIYCNILTDSGTISANEVALAAASVGSTLNGIFNVYPTALGGSSGAILAITSLGASELSAFFLVKPSASTAILSPAMVSAALKDFSTQSSSFFCKTNNNTGMLMATVTGTEKAILQPFCWALV